MTQLLERTTAGFTVEVSLDPDFPDALLLVGKTEVHEAYALVPRDRALHAFEHPCVYLPEPQRFFDQRAAESGPVQVQPSLERVREAQSALAEVSNLPSCDYCGQTLLAHETHTCDDCRQNAA